MIVMSCNWCGMSIADLAYVVQPVRASTNEPIKNRSTDHVHWDCLPNWVEYMRGGADPLFLKKTKNQCAGTPLVNGKVQNNGS